MTPLAAPMGGAPRDPTCGDRNAFDCPRATNVWTGVAARWTRARCRPLGYGCPRSAALGSATSPGRARISSATQRSQGWGPPSPRRIVSIVAPTSGEPMAVIVERWRGRSGRTPETRAPATGDAPGAAALVVVASRVPTGDR